MSKRVCCLGLIILRGFRGSGDDALSRRGVFRVPVCVCARVRLHLTFYRDAETLQHDAARRLALVRRARLVALQIVIAKEIVFFFFFFY